MTDASEQAARDGLAAGRVEEAERYLRLIGPQDSETVRTLQMTCTVMLGLAAAERAEPRIRLVSELLGGETPSKMRLDGAGGETHRALLARLRDGSMTADPAPFPEQADRDLAPRLPALLDPQILPSRRVAELSGVPVAHLTGWEDTLRLSVLDWALRRAPKVTAAQVEQMALRKVRHLPRLRGERR